MLEIMNVQHEKELEAMKLIQKYILQLKNFIETFSSRLQFQYEGKNRISDLEYRIKDYQKKVT